MSYSYAENLRRSREDYCFPVREQDYAATHYARQALLAEDRRVREIVKAAGLAYREPKATVIYETDEAWVAARNAYLRTVLMEEAL